MATPSTTTRTYLPHKEVTEPLTVKVPNKHVSVLLTHRIYTVVEMERNTNDAFKDVLRSFMLNTLGEANEKLVEKHSEGKTVGGQPYVVQSSLPNRNLHYVAYIGLKDLDSTSSFCQRHNVTTVNDRLLIARNGDAIIENNFKLKAKSG